MKASPGSIITLKIERPAYGGVFIGRHEGKIVMVKGALLQGETAEVAIESEKRDYLVASAVRILEQSPERADPPCRFFGLCGGCHFQHIPYKLQLEIKEEVLRDTLKRMARLETGLSPSLYAERPCNYRLRGQFKLSGNRTGFYKSGTRDIVDIDSCPLMTDELNSSYENAREITRGLNIKELHITTGDISLALIRSPEGAISRSLRKKLSTAFQEAGFSGLAIESALKPTYLYNKKYITLPLDDIKYTISPMSFFQSNWSLNQDLVKLITRTLGLTKDKKVLDLYAGAGNFSLPLAKDAELTAIEENPYAIEDGKRNLEINGITGCRFIHSSAERFDLREHYDILILDPPRPGLTGKVIDKVLYRLPDRIVYISCNPATFSRDMKKLLNRYEIESIRMIDLFPQTFHIESLAFLRKK